MGSRPMLFFSSNSAQVGPKMKTTAPGPPCPTSASLTLGLARTPSHLIRPGNGRPKAGLWPLSHAPMQPFDDRFCMALHCAPHTQTTSLHQARSPTRPLLPQSFTSSLLPSAHARSIPAQSMLLPTFSPCPSQPATCQFSHTQPTPHAYTCSSLPTSPSNPPAHQVALPPTPTSHLHTPAPSPGERQSQQLDHCQLASAIRRTHALP